MSIGKKYLEMIRRGLGAFLNRQNTPARAVDLFWSTLASTTLASGYVLCLLVLLLLTPAIAVLAIMLWWVEVQNRAMSNRTRLILALAILIAICFYVWPLNKGGQALENTTLFYI